MKRNVPVFVSNSSAWRHRSFLTDRQGYVGYGHDVLADPPMHLVEPTPVARSGGRVFVWAKLGVTSRYRRRRLVELSRDRHELWFSARMRCRHSIVTPSIC